MFRPLVLALTVAIPVVFTPSARADDTPKEIIEKAIKAHGGQDFLAKHQAGQTRNKGKITIPGVGDVEFTQEVSFMLPNKVKDSMEMKIMNQNITVLTLINGDKSVIEVNGKAIDIPDAAKDAIKGVGHMLKVGRLVALVNDKAFVLDTIGEDKVEGKPVVGVRVSMKGQKDISLFFDKKTNLLAKLEYRTADATTGNEVNEERIVTEYAKNKDGIAIPKKAIIKRDGKQFLEAEVLEMNFLEKLDDSEFKK